MGYPRWVYNSAGEGVLVETEEEFAELEGEWLDSPAAEFTPKPRRGRPPKAAVKNAEDTDN